MDTHGRPLLEQSLAFIKTMIFGYTVITSKKLDKIEKSWLELSLQVERLEQNFGFAIANNIGARLAYGQWIMRASHAK